MKAIYKNCSNGGRGMLLINTLTCLWLSTLLLTGLAHADVDAFQDGNLISLQADTGKWFSRCQGCQQTVNPNSLSDTVTVHVDNPNVTYAQFTVVNMHNGKIALRADTGKFVARCQGCLRNAAYPNIATIHVDDPNAGYAQFQPFALPNGRYALLADTGGYLTRCNNCSPGASSSDIVTMHITNPNEPYAQWNVAVWNRITPVTAQVNECNGWAPSNNYTMENTTGWNLNSLSFSNLGGSNLSGFFHQTGCKTWSELGANSETRFQFDEVNRDDWSVYLVDRSRNVNIQLDVHRKRVIYSEGNGPRSDLYKILSASRIYQ